MPASFQQQPRTSAQGLRDYFHSRDIQIDVADNDLAEMTVNPPEEPQFPTLILLAAIMKDVIDLVATSSIIFSIFTLITSFILSLVIFFWLLGKLGFAEKQLVRWFIRWAVLVVLVEFIPLVNAIPMATIFVILAYNRERAVVQLFFTALKSLQGRVGSY